jgi:hypothetical protein
MVEDCVTFTATEEEAQSIVARLRDGESIQAIRDEQLRAL